MHPWLLPITERRIYLQWVLAGRPLPAPPLVKQRIVKSYQRPEMRTFIETGTYTGEMIAALLDRFEHVVSIELHPQLVADARRRFAAHPHVEILDGDSGSLFARALADVKEPALCWLDAHFTGGTAAGEGQDVPVLREIQAVIDHPVRGHVVLIDDARYFTGHDGYPTIETVRKRCAIRGGDFAVADDIIRWHA